MKMGNCMNCRYKEIKFSDLSKIDNDMALICKGISTSGDMYGKCTAGNTEKLVGYYREHGDKPSSERENIFIECYRPTEGCERLDKLLNMMDDMLETVKEDNASKGK